MPTTSFPRPGSCPQCDQFVSIRTKHAYNCRPVPQVGTEIRWTKASPMNAWPVTHIRNGRWARSPIEGIGPRLLVRLARHKSAARRELASGKRPRYGPSHALRDLLAMPAHQVLDEVLNPEPAWIPCDGTWHRVLLCDGELGLIDHGMVDLLWSGRPPP